MQKLKVENKCNIYEKWSRSRSGNLVGWIKERMLTLWKED